MSKKTTPFKNMADVFSEYEKYGMKVRCLEAETVQRQRRAVERLLPLLGVVDLPSLQRVKPDRLEDFMVTLSKEKGPGTYHGACYGLRSFFRYAELTKVVDRPLQDWIPTVHKPRLAKVPFCLSLDLIHKLLGSLDLTNPRDIQDSAILTMLTDYGVRGIQIRKLKLSDIDWSNDRIHFPKVKRGSRLVMPLTPPVGNSLLRYLREARPQAPYSEVFLSFTKQEPFYDAGSLTYMVYSRLKKAGIQLPEGVPVGTHLFRHSLASRLLQKDVPLKQIADLLGHRHLNTTFVYTKIDLKSLRQACLEWPVVQR